MKYAVGALRATCQQDVERGIERRRPVNAMKRNAAIPKRTSVRGQHFPVVVLLAKAKYVHRSKTMRHVLPECRYAGRSIKNRLRSRTIGFVPSNGVAVSQ